MVTAVLVHLAYLVSYYMYLRWQLYSAVPQFPVFWPSEMTSATFCESSPESSPPNTDGPGNKARPLPWTMEFHEQQTVPFHSVL